MFLLLPILLPIVCGMLVSVLRMEDRKKRQLFVITAVVINSAIVGLLLLNRPTETLTLLSLSPNMTIALKMDGLATVFAGLVAVLWPIATVYAFGYMKHEGKEVKFYAFYTMTYGVTIGVATSANLLTLYLFYELLTLITLPLVTHSMSQQAIAAGRKYIIYSITGASCSFIGMVFLFHYADTTDFIMGGVLQNVALTPEARSTLLFVFVLTFVGFGVKAAIFPFHGWLPSASVAPTTVTALLHAVAVVKAGAYATIRATYYLFGADFARGTWAQNVALALAATTILFGSLMAQKEQHFKRRMAYSTVSNLSYILFGVALMTPLGLTGALTQMVAHAIVKITLFYCVGAVIYQTGFEYVQQLFGLGKRMKIVFLSFTIGALALAGIPPFPGFYSKYRLIIAGIDLATPMAYVGIGVLLISALLTVMYLFTIVVYAYVPGNHFEQESVAKAKDPEATMSGSLIVLCALIILFGLFAGNFINYFEQISAGLI